MFEGVLDDLDALKVLRFVMNCNDLSKQTDSELAKDLETIRWNSHCIIENTNH